MVSFKIDKKGRRYVPELTKVNAAKSTSAGEGQVLPSAIVNGKRAREDDGKLVTVQYPAVGDDFPCLLQKKRLRMPCSDSRFTPGRFAADMAGDYKSSFAINLFPDGFSLDITSEMRPGVIQTLDEASALPVHPYERSTEAFLQVSNSADQKQTNQVHHLVRSSNGTHGTGREGGVVAHVQAVDQGRVPAQMLEDIPCTYYDGCVLCEVRDYRDAATCCVLEGVPPGKRPRTAGPLPPPRVNKVLLQPHTSSLLQDCADLAGPATTYQDLMELESKLLLSVAPPLCLNPDPKVGATAAAIRYQRVIIKAQPPTPQPPTPNSKPLKEEVSDTLCGWEDPPPPPGQTEPVLQPEQISAHPASFQVSPDPPPPSP